jgi:protease-4
MRLVTLKYYHSVSMKSSFLSNKDKIAVILAEGEIQSGTGSSNDAIYSDDMSSLIRELNEDEDVKAVVLRVNSPGGSALASDVIWRSLQYLKKKKKFVTSFSDVAASGGYYIAAGSDYIFAEPLTITGSIGVFGLMFDTEKFFDHKLGITFDVVKTHASADMASGRALTPFELKRVQGQVDYTYKTFLNVVKEGRKKFPDVEAVNEIAQGRVWIGATAKDIGLVDSMGSLDDAIATAASLAKLKKYDVVWYPDEKEFFDKIFDALGEITTAPLWFTKIKETLFPNPHQDRIYTRLPYLLEM